MGFTNASSNAFPPATLQPLYRIWRDWCIGDSLGYLNDNFLYLETLINSVSAIQTNLLPGIAKAWVNFDGTRNTSQVIDTTNTPRYVRSSFNISSVSKKDLGNYRINFTNTYSPSGYVVVASCQETPSVGWLSPYTTGYYVWTQPSNYLSTSVDIRCGSYSGPGGTGTDIDIGVVTVAIFAN